MKICNVIIVLSLFIVIYACNNGGQKKENDTLTSGMIKIAVDETFKPIIDEELIVFSALNPEAKVIPIYCDEVKAVDLLMKDSVRLIVSSRTLTSSETEYLNRKKFFPQSIKIAVDGLAIIVNKNNMDSLISTWQFRKILSGGISHWNQLNGDGYSEKIDVVFDNPNSSTVHYVIDSICYGTSFSDNVKALSRNSEVIRYVADNDYAMGIIGANWIYSKTDTANLSFIDNVRIMAVSRDEKAESYNSYKPYQAYLALDKYPLTRNVYIILNDPKNGLPSGLTSFITGFRGQRIILKSGLLPAIATIRIINVNQE